MHCSRNGQLPTFKQGEDRDGKNKGRWAYLGLGIDLGGGVDVDSANNLGSSRSVLGKLLRVGLQQLLQVQSVHRDSRSIIFCISQK